MQEPPQWNETQDYHGSTDEPQTIRDPSKSFKEIQKQNSLPTFTKPAAGLKSHNRHPLLAPNVLSRPKYLVTTIPLKVLGYEGYTLSAPRGCNGCFGDDWELLNLLNGSTGYPSSTNFKKPCILKNIKKTLEGIVSFQHNLVFSKTIQDRHVALFDFKHPLKVSMPQQMIRYNDILIGHCVLIPGQKVVGKLHITQGHEYVKVCFFLACNHRGRGVLFAALKALLQLAVEDYGVSMVYAEADTLNTTAISLLYNLMDWSELQWGGTGTTADSTIRIEHDHISSREDVSTEIEIRPAIQWVWPIGDFFSPGRSAKNCKPLDKYEHTT